MKGYWWHSQAENAILNRDRTLLKDVRCNGRGSFIERDIWEGPSHVKFFRRFVCRISTKGGQVFLATLSKVSIAPGPGKPNTSAS